MSAAPDAAEAEGERASRRGRKSARNSGKRRPVIDGERISDPVALGTAAYALLDDLNSNRNPLAKATALFLMQTKGWLEFCGEHANARGENFSRDVKNMQRDHVLVELGKTQTAEAIAKLIHDDAQGRSADELLTENPYEPGTLKYKARLVLKYGGALTIDAPRIQQILDEAKISKSDTI